MTTSAENASILARASRSASWLGEHAGIIRFAYATVDLLAVVLTCVVSYWMVFGLQTVAREYRAVILVAVLFTWLVFNALGLYTSWRGRGYVEQIKMILSGWVIVVGGMIIGGYLLGFENEISRDWLQLATASSLAVLLPIRLAAIAGLRSVRRHGMNHKRLLIVGAGDWGAQVAEKLQDAEWLGMDILCFLDADSSRYGQTVAGIPITGGFDLLEELVAQKGIDEVWICLPLQSSRAAGSDHLEEVMNRLRNSTVTQRLVPDLEEMRLLNQPITEIMGMPVVNLNTSPMVGTNRVLKALEDRILAVLILLLISPVMLAIAIAIRMDSPGPVFFRQLRHGWDGKPITVYKFRSMKNHQEENGKITQAGKNDPRVTRVGAFLRRTSLDELPQFVNVLQGTMSIVGPRPHAIEHNEMYRDQIDFYMQRHKVKPGITGWAQVNGYRGETESVEKMRQRVSFDLYYIEHWSLWFDLKIIGRTVFTGFVHENAY